MPHNITIDYLPVLPGWAIGLITAALLALVGWGALTLRRKDVPRRWVTWLGVIRVVAVLLFAACLVQPTLSYLRNRQRHPELVVLVDTSQSMEHADSADGRTRLAAAVQQLNESGLLKQLGDDFDLKLFAFDRRAYPVEADQLDSLEPGKEATDFSRSFGSAADLLSAESDAQPSTAASRHVLLVSDGQDHGAANFAETAARAGAIVDVLPVGGEKPAASSTAVVARVLAPSRVLLASETQFVVVTERGADQAESYTLTLFEDGKEVLEQDLTFAAGAAESRTTLAYRPTEAGLKHYEFSLRPQGAEKPATSDEPRYGVNVQVIDDHIEMLILEDRWRWDFKYLKRLLEEDPSFSLTAMLTRGGGQYVQMGEPDRRVNLGSFPQSRAEVDWFDVIVLGDVQPAQWPRGLSGAIADAVIEDGRSLIVVAGPGLKELAQVPELHALLPVELSIDSAKPIEGPLGIRLTPEGAQSGWFVDAEGAVLTELPEVDRIYAPLRKRPAATVLVEAANQANSSGNLILMAEQTVGRGRVLYIGTDALWKWQMLTPLDEDSRTIYSSLWQRALRALTPLRTSIHPLWVTTDRSRYTAGDRVTVRAESSLAAEEQGAKLEASIVLPDERRLTLPLDPDANQPGSYVAGFDAVTPGRYRIALAAKDGEAESQASTAIEVTTAQSELDDTGVDPAALAEIASRTGGKVVDPNDPQTWPAAGDDSQQVEERKTANLLDNFTLLTLLCLVLGGDWLVRMLRGYV